MERSDAWTLTENLYVQRGQADPFSAAFRCSSLAMVLTDPALPDNPILFANDAFLQLTGYSRHEVDGRNCRFLQGSGSDPLAIRQITEAIQNASDISIDILSYKKDETPFWSSLYVSPVLDASGTPQYFFLSLQDVTMRKQYEFAIHDMKQELEWKVKTRTRDLETALEQSKLLMHEVDHRVKNNLQMISAMLMLQSMRIPDAKIKATLLEMLERVDAMGMVHKRLYQSDDITNFDVAEFAQEIADTLVSATGRDDISLVIDAESVSIKADIAASVALVLNEIITNALKHAFPAGRPGRLRVSVKPSMGNCEISIMDNGQGIPAVAPEKRGFGRTLIESMIQQLRASIEWLPDSPGTHVRIVLPLA